MQEKEKKFGAEGRIEDLELELQKAGFFIKKAELLESEPLQCEHCMKEGRFDFYNRGWFIEGDFYCGEHKQSALEMLKKVKEGAEQSQEERKKMEEERKKMLGEKQ